MQCSLCNGPMIELGTLGNVARYRCRDCGAERSDDPRDGPYPAPEIDAPDLDTLQAWVCDSVVEATDGCHVEPDGMCEHGHPSWLLRLGLI